MRKIILGLAATALLASPLAIAAAVRATVIRVARMTGRSAGHASALEMTPMEAPERVNQHAQGAGMTYRLRPGPPGPSRSS